MVCYLSSSGKSVTIEYYSPVKIGRLISTALRRLYAFALLIFCGLSRKDFISSFRTRIEEDYSETGGSLVMEFRAFPVANSWFRGNLHTHSNISDGRLEPRGVVELYKEQGWDFLALTEHEVFTHWKEFNDESFLIMPGIEVGVGAPGPYQCHHIVGIHQGKGHAEHLVSNDNSELWGVEGAQRAIDELAQKGYFSIYCHPVWSRIQFEEIEHLQRFCALEIYNHGCAVEDHTGHALYYWDAFLRRGVKIWGVATDDSHQWNKDYCGGWVMVSAPSLTVRDIGDALLLGQFYSSNGPVITDYGVKDGQVYVTCSPAQSIHFVAFERRGRSYHAADGGTITSASHSLHGDEKYVRVEVIDEWGRTAWTNPIFF